MAGNITYVKQKSGVIYAYENLGTWDPINKKKICRRKLLGRFNPETGAIEPTDNRNKRLKKEYVPKPYEKDYKMPRTVKERGEEILRLLKELYELMEKELSNIDLDITRITEMMKISRTKFYYKVKGLTGENPSVFFKRYKLNRAADLLKEGKYNMSEIAYMTGFNTLSHFSTSFKKQFGVPPSEYVG